MWHSELRLWAISRGLHNSLPLLPGHLLFFPEALMTTQPDPSALFEKLALCSFCSVVLLLNLLLSYNVPLYTLFVSPFMTQTAPALLTPAPHEP